MWNELKTPDDGAYLLALYGYFHDALLKEARFDSGCYVDHDLSIVFNDHFSGHLRCIFQRQLPNPSTIEMIFIGLQCAMLLGNENNEIYGASLELEHDWWIWSEDCGSQSPEIRARRVFWRIKDDWLGKRERYSAATNQDLDYYDPLEATVSPYPISHGRRSAGEAI